LWNFLWLAGEKIGAIGGEKRRRNPQKPRTKMYEKNKTDRDRREKFMLLFKKSLQLYTKNG